MPILVIPDINQSLSQGDLLKDVPLYVTKEDKSAELIEGMALVLSRECVIKNKKDITVALVKKYKIDTLANIESFEDLVDLFDSQRDGVIAPDRFYLGHIAEGETSRYSEHLDSIHTISVPLGDERLEWAKEHRVATLSPEFIRDLHLRVFYSVARSGFNDTGWLCSGDLKLILQAGRQAIAEKEAELEKCKTELAKFDILEKGKKAKDKKESSISKLENDITKKKEQIAPYFEKLNRRE